MGINIKKIAGHDINKVRQYYLFQITQWLVKQTDGNRQHREIVPGVSMFVDDPSRHDGMSSFGCTTEDQYFHHVGLLERYHRYSNK